MLKPPPAGQPYFRFYPGAYEEGVFEQTGESCEVCETPGAWMYQGVVYGLSPAADTRFCATCMKTGLVYGFLGDAKENWIGFHEWFFTSDDVDDALSDELMYHSPSPSSWNPHGWPVVNREPLVYIGRGDDKLFADNPAVRAAMRKEQDATWPGETSDPVPQYYMIFQSLDGAIYKAALDLD
mgnify:CR=1 FL=1